MSLGIRRLAVLTSSDELTFDIAFAPNSPQNSLPFPANFMPDGGLELLPAGGTSGATGTIEAEAPVATGETVTLRYYVPARCGW